MSELFTAIDSNVWAFIAAVIVGYLCMGVVAAVLGMWEEMHR